jgi:lipopolysaccharide transport system permease protein
LLNPLILAVVLNLAFRVFLRVTIEDYPFFVLSALFPWTWFSASVLVASGTMIENAPVIKKVRIPRSFFVFASVLTQLLNFLFTIPVIIVIAWVYNRDPQFSWLIGFPLLMILQFFLTTGMALMVSILNAYFRDMEHLLAVLLNLLFWLTPIIYPLETAPGEYQRYLGLNPLVHLTTAWRELVMSGRLDWPAILNTFLFSGVIFLAGFWIFRRGEKRLDEVL